MFLVLLETWKAAVLVAIFIVTFSAKGETKLIGIFEECNRKTPYTQPIGSYP